MYLRPSRVVSPPDTEPPASSTRPPKSLLTRAQRVYNRAARLRRDGEERTGGRRCGRCSDKDLRCIDDPSSAGSCLDCYLSRQKCSFSDDKAAPPKSLGKRKRSEVASETTDEVSSTRSWRPRAAFSIEIPPAPLPVTSGRCIRAAVVQQPAEGPPITERTWQEERSAILARLQALEERIAVLEKRP